MVAENSAILQIYIVAKWTKKQICQFRERHLHSMSCCAILQLQSWFFQNVLPRRRHSAWIDSAMGTGFWYAYRARYVTITMDVVSLWVGWWDLLEGWETLSSKKNLRSSRASNVCELIGCELERKNLARTCCHSQFCKIPQIGGKEQVEYQNIRVERRKTMPRWEKTPIPSKTPQNRLLSFFPLLLSPTFSHFLPLSPYLIWFSPSFDLFSP